MQTLERIHSDPHNAFVTLDSETAIRDATLAGHRLRIGARTGSLDGTLVGIKDNIDTAGVRTTRGSALFYDRVPACDAAVVRRLRAAGAIVVGKTNLGEMACGTLGDNSVFGKVLNPHNPARYPGGSSSGSAAAVAAGLVPVAIGTDTACSVRQPAALCGVVGFKPTYGRIPTDGISVCSDRLDHVGVLARDVRTVGDVAIALSRSVPNESRLRTQALPVNQLHIGILRGEFYEECDTDVKAVFDETVAVLPRMVSVVKDIDFGIDLREVDSQASILGADMLDHHGFEINNRRGDFQPYTLEWVEFYESIDKPLYDTACRFLDSVGARVSLLMRNWDAVICPTTRSGAGLWTEAPQESRSRRVLNCSIWNVTGQPSLTIPVGRAHSGMPLGILINGRRGQDRVVLSLGEAIEREMAKMRV